MATFKPEGIITALVTPFDEKEDIDEQALRNMIDFQIRNGADGVFVGGSTAEAYSLEFEEKKELLRIAVDCARERVPVYMGAGGSSTRQAIRVCRMACEEGADALSVITPYFVTPNQEELYHFYKDVAESVDLPIVLYNHPLRTSVSISPETVRKPSRIPSIAGIKDSSSSLTSAMSFVECGGKDFSVLSGNDSMIVSILDLGGAGAVSASACFAPELVCSLYREYRKGNRGAALELQYRLFKIRNLFSMGTYPAMIKEACAIAGIDMGKCRRPVRSFDEKQLAELRSILSEAGVSRAPPPPVSGGPIHRADGKA